MSLITVPRRPAPILHQILEAPVAILKGRGKLSTVAACDWLALKQDVHTIAMRRVPGGHERKLTIISKGGSSQDGAQRFTGESCNRSGCGTEEELPPRY